MSLTGHIEKGQVILDTPAALPDGTRVTVAPTTNGVPTPPADNSDIDPDGVMSARMIELIRQSQRENPDEPGDAERWPNALKHTLDLPEDASAQVDHYLYGTPKR